MVSDCNTVGCYYSNERITYKFFFSLKSALEKGDAYKYIIYEKGGDMLFVNIRKVGGPARVDALSIHIGKVECGAGRHGGLPLREGENKQLNDSTNQQLNISQLIADRDICLSWGCRHACRPCRCGTKHVKFSDFFTRDCLTS